MKDYIEERVVNLARYIVERIKRLCGRRQEKFGISKSTVHIDVTKRGVFVKVVYEVR